MEIHNNVWVKLGCIVKPDPNIWWMSHYCGPSFVVVQENVIDLYMVGRDVKGISRIGLIRLCKEDLTKILSISKDPVFDVGQVGCFDESGVSYPWIIESSNKVLLYYVGWQAGGLGGFQTNIGLAEKSSEEACFKRVSRAPILERINEEPICTGSLCVIKNNEKWQMWYTCFDRWEKLENGHFQHYYYIKECFSDDGIKWQRPGKIAIDFNNADNYVIAKPMVIADRNRLQMWYSYRGENYKIGYAEKKSSDGWVRKDNKFMWSKKSVKTEFDSEMQEYAFIFEVGGKKYMTYNGNGFGKSGLGIAVLEEAL